MNNENNKNTMYILFGCELIDCTGQHYDHMLGLALTKKDAIIKLMKYYHQIHPCNICTCKQSIDLIHRKYMYRNSKFQCKCFPLKYQKMVISSDEIIEEKVFHTIHELQTVYTNLS